MSWKITKRYFLFIFLSGTLVGFGTLDAFLAMATWAFGVAIAILAEGMVDELR